MNNPAVNKKKRKSSSSSSAEDDNKSVDDTYRLHQYGGYTFHSDDEESESEDEQEDNELGYDPYYAGLGANTKKHKRRRVPRRVGHNRNHHPGAKRRHWGDLSIASTSAAVTFSSDECDDDNDRGDGTARRVRFSRQIVSDVQYRPYTAREDVRELFYSKADERRFRAEYAEWKRTSSLFDCDEDEDDSSSESESDDGGDDGGEEAIVDIDEQWRPTPPGDDDDLEEQQGAAAEEEGDLDDDLLGTAHEDSPSPTTVSPDVSDEDEMEEAEAVATTSDNDDESTDSESEED